MQPRNYQSRTVDVTMNHIDTYQDSVPLVAAPTASGKSIIAALLAERFSQRSTGMTIVLAHRKELVKQNASKLPSHLDIGIYSSGLGKREMKRITVAGFQSLRNAVDRLPSVGALLIDEAHWATKAYKEFYEALLLKNRNMRAVGLTATPYDGTANRTHLHMLPDDRRLFTGIGAEIPMSELMAGGYLAPLTPYVPTTKLSSQGVAINKATGDFSTAQLQAAVDIPELVRDCAKEIIDIFAFRNSIIVFCAGVDHAEHVTLALQLMGQTAEVVHGGTSAAMRDKHIEDFRAGRIKYLVACEVLLVGFDAPRTDGIANLRATLSALVWVQLLGRGMRLSPETGKVDCLVADFTTNSSEFPPVDEIEGQPPKNTNGQAPVRFCDNCFSIMLAAVRKCNVCGEEFPHAEPKPGYSIDASTGLLVSGAIKNPDGTRTYGVTRVQYRIATTNAGAPAIVADYFAAGRSSAVASDYYNMWHHVQSIAKRDAERWLRRLNRPGSVPMTAQEALNRAELGALREPKTVTVKPGSPYPIKFT